MTWSVNTLITGKDIPEMKNEKLYKIIVAAMMAALACVATMIIRIPSPMQGYVNLGDAVVLMCGWILGPYMASLRQASAACWRTYWRHIRITRPVRLL